MWSPLDHVEASRPINTQTRHSFTEFASCVVSFVQICFFLSVFQHQNSKLKSRFPPAMAQIQRWLPKFPSFSTPCLKPWLTDGRDAKVYSTATTPAMAMAAAAKLPSCFLGSAAALPVAEEPPALLVDEAPELRDAEAPVVADELPEPVAVAELVAVAVYGAVGVLLVSWHVRGGRRVLQQFS